LFERCQCDKTKQNKLPCFIVKKEKTLVHPPGKQSLKVITSWK
jgi:hypothetical protein